MRKRRSKIWLMEDSLFKELFNKANTIKELVESCGLADAGGNRNTIRYRVEGLGLDINILKNKSKEYLKNSSKFFNQEGKYRISDIFIKGSSVGRKTVKSYIKKYNIIEQNKCSVCGIGRIWNGIRLVLVLDHINGVRDDNRPENLRYLCPNCNSQSETFAGRNNNRKLIINENRIEKRIKIKVANKKVCSDCGRIICKDALKCRKCATISARAKYKIRPSLEDLEKVIQFSNVKIGKMYGVSETAVRKWKKFYNIKQSFKI